MIVRSGRPLRGTVEVPGDKSITHRGLLFGALAMGKTEMSGALLEGDCQATLGCLRALGIPVEHTVLQREDRLAIAGHGMRGFRRPDSDLYCIRSGTTMRLLCGIMAGQSFPSRLTGDQQLLRRPMGRVVEPLRQMGAQIADTGGCAPLIIAGGELHGIEYTLPIASAQVKSALLLAGLLAEGPTTIREPASSRDHTERMLSAMGARLQVGACEVTVAPGPDLEPISIDIPGDISSAAFLLSAGSIVPGSEIVIRNVGLNPTRAGMLGVLQRMGGEIVILDRWEAGGEPAGDVRVRYAGLQGTLIGGEEIPALIDELPALAVLATQAQGVTEIRDAGELRVKETDRIEAMVTQLRRLGAQVESRPDGMMIEGPCRLLGGEVDSGGDHRVAMSLIVAGLCAGRETLVHGTACISDSFPGFDELMRQLGAEMEG